MIYYTFLFLYSLAKSYIILLCYVFTLFVILAVGLAILQIFSKNKIFISLTFLIVSVLFCFFYFSFILFIYFFCSLFFIYLFFYFTILYWFCHTLTWICHGCTWVPNPEPPSHHPPHIIISVLSVIDSCSYFYSSFPSLRFVLILFLVF